MTTASEITRCIKYDFGRTPHDLRQGAEYCERIARTSALNPWAEPGMSAAYADAAQALRLELQEKEAA
jgi:hypothetical protein